MFPKCSAVCSSQLPHQHARPSFKPLRYLISTLIIPSETQCKHPQQAALDDNFLAKSTTSLPE